MKLRLGVLGLTILLAAMRVDADPTNKLVASYGAKGTWTEYFQSARIQAKKMGRPILADFSGSGWCGSCIRLDREVFSQAEFRSYAANNWILFLADFPNRKNAQDARIARQNALLMTHYQVEGFPTVLLLDSDGKLLALTGYLPGGAEAYVSHLKELLAKTGWKPPTKAGSVTP